VFSKRFLYQNSIIDVDKTGLVKAELNDSQLQRIDTNLKTPVGLAVTASAKTENTSTTGINNSGKIEADRTVGTDKGGIGLYVDYGFINNNSTGVVNVEKGTVNAPNEKAIGIFGTNSTKIVNDGQVNAGGKKSIGILGLSYRIDSATGIVKNPKDELSLAYLETITSQLVKIAMYITKERALFIKNLSKLAQKNMLNISNQKEDLELKYKSSILDMLNINSVEDKDFNEENIIKKIMDKSYDDIMRGSTRIGPHHDDLEFFINKLDAKMYASQGQQRSIVLSLKLSEIDYLKSKTGSYPILLLDDVLSELDRNRQLKLLDAINENVQTFITTPSISDIKEDLLKKAKVFKINNGTISEIL